MPSRAGTLRASPGEAFVLGSDGQVWGCMATLLGNGTLISPVSSALPSWEGDEVPSNTSLLVTPPMGDFLDQPSQVLVDPSS